MINEIKKEWSKLQGTSAEIKDFSLVVGTVLVLLGTLRNAQAFSSQSKLLFGIGVVILVSGILFPIVLKPIQKLWMMLAFVLSHIMTTVLMFTVFTVLIIPTSLIMRYVMKTHLLQPIDSSKKSYWNDRPKEKRTAKYYQKLY